MSETISCPACGSANEAGRKFCGECGTALAADVSVMWNAECAVGEVLRGMRHRARGDHRAGGGGSRSERARRRTPPRLRPLRRPRRLHDGLGEPRRRRRCASSSPATSRRRGRLIELYGGTVEKFIGDAVMAVWGTPTATEDDAERAVRAALDLVAAVSALGDEVGAPELRARAGVLTGEAAVTIGAEGQGMVAGDLVNTASRMQSAAEPGHGASSARRRDARPSRRSSTRTRARSSSRERRGCTPLWRALRVVSGRAARSSRSGLEAPFVGRDRELRQIKDLFHASRRGAQGTSRLGHRDRRDRQVAALAGSSTSTSTDSRTTVYWHRGRCLSYGEGVAYWALADMVRMRCRHRRRTRSRRRHSPSCTPRSRSTSSTPRSGASSSPGSRTCSGSPSTRPATSRTSSPPGGSSSSASRESYPTVLVFEDMQWADASLLDFVEYLLDWSRSSPDLRDHARAAGAAGAPADLGRRAAELHVALPRAALAAGDGGAAGRSRARASRSRFATASSLAPRASRSTRSRPCGCCSTAACSSRTAPRTG